MGIVPCEGRARSACGNVPVRRASAKCMWELCPATGERERAGATGSQHGVQGECSHQCARAKGAKCTLKCTCAKNEGKVPVVPVRRASANVPAQLGRSSNIPIWNVPCEGQRRVPVGLCPCEVGARSAGGARPKSERERARRNWVSALVFRGNIPIRNVPVRRASAKCRWRVRRVEREVPVARAKVEREVRVARAKAEREVLAMRVRRSSAKCRWGRCEGSSAKCWYLRVPALMYPTGYSPQECVCTKRSCGEARWAAFEHRGRSPSGSRQVSAARVPDESRRSDPRRV